MNRGLRLLTRCLLLWVLVAMFFQMTPALAEAGDPWYEDLSGHWASDYIRFLWREGVADGYVTNVWRVRGLDYYLRRVSNFRPNRTSTRAQQAMLLAKVYGLEPFNNPTPSFRDVPRSYQAYPNKNGYRYIEAANRQGFLAVTGSRFEPDTGISREAAVVSLIRSLGLENYAASLTRAEVDGLLARFRDQRSISSFYRPYVATATRLRIVEGYPDGSFKPGNLMTRAESATVVYRSCLIRADAKPSVFFPYDEGPDSFTEIALFTLKNSNAAAWSLTFQDMGGRIVAELGEGRLNGRASPRISVPSEVIWDGQASRGSLLPMGTYFYQARVMDTTGQIHASVMKPVVIGNRFLRASLSPSTAGHFQEVQVMAETAGWARRVFVQTPGGDVIELSPSRSVSSEANAWRGSFIIGKGEPRGTHTVNVTATYDFVQKSRLLAYEVVIPSSSPEYGGDTEDPWEQVVFSLIR